MDTTAKKFYIAFVEAIRDAEKAVFEEAKKCEVGVITPEQLKQSTLNELDKVKQVLSEA